MPWGMKGDTRPSLEDFYSPFLAEYLTGYERWLNSDSTNWYAMLSGGKSGVGIHVSQIFDPECCTGWLGRQADSCLWTHYNQPYLYPSAVQWHSVIDPETNQPYPQLVEWFDIDYPCVALQHVYSPVPEHRWAIDNLQYEHSLERFDGDVNGNYIQIGANSEIPILGVVPIWTVMPLKTEHFNQFKKDIHNFELEDQMYIFGECWCTVDNAPCYDECATEKDYRNKCNCSSQEDAQTRMEDSFANPPVIEEFLSSTSTKIWTLAQDAFYRGWKTVYDNLDEGARNWAYLLWLQQSPFLVSPGQKTTDQETSTDSTSLETFQAS